jgi:hypothetical protein
MKQQYEGQGLTWFFRIVFALAIIGAVSVLGWSIYAIWKALT